MTRVKRGCSRHKRCKKIFNFNKGFQQPSRTIFSVANQKYVKANHSAFQHRRKKKTILRQIWITRINSIASLYGINYSQLIYNFKKSNILLNRKMISQLFFIDPEAFTQYLKLYLNS